MNNQQEPITSSQQILLLPEPDLANITVLAHNLPNKPILPWNRFDYTDSNRKVNKQEPKLFTNLSLLTILLSTLPIIVLFALFQENLSISIETKAKNTKQADSQVS